ncbi:MAG: secondary thiamine-phosphate synthase enzyme YjbQ [Tissierellia bacterium]|nr:secondary thiamine-phosphate synthase enzyme YjbQ [Tissierellia bacterium]
MVLEFQITSHKRNEMINIDEFLIRALEEQKIESGIALIFCPHTTAGITINENGDPDVQRDLLYLWEKLSPHYQEYRHFEGNSDAHGKSSIIGCSETVIIAGGRPIFGTWQSLYFCEFDGPRHRKFYIKLMGD